MSAMRIACVLSGGGVKSAAHVGALRALEERGVRPDRYVGTSMGAVVAAGFAAGRTYDDMLRQLLLVTRRDVARVSWGVLSGPFTTSLFQVDRLRETIARLVPARRFADLHTPLTVTSVDVETGDLVLFGDGGDASVPLIDALTASCALPIFYPPVRIGARSCADGGLRAVLPLTTAAGFGPDAIFAVRAGPSFAARPSERPAAIPPLLRAHNRAMRVMMAAQTDAEIARWRHAQVPLILVEPTVEQAATFAVGRAVAYVEEGYRAAVSALRDSPEGARLFPDAAQAPVARA
ncbi:MAG: patatin-like phospholipase family protein [Gemmatimonadales bacterium]|nr:patatin-like phospholipase family protein [Gemmatimonadales bacterium]